jgi:hypothetical protein
VLFVITVEEAELLLAVGRVISGVHIQDDDLAGTGVGLEVQVQQSVGEPAQVFFVVTRFSKRDRVGWEASSPELSGALPAMIFIAGSLVSQAASLLSS